MPLAINFQPSGFGDRAGRRNRRDVNGRDAVTSAGSERNPPSVWRDARIHHGPLVADHEVALRSGSVVQHSD